MLDSVLDSGQQPHLDVTDRTPHQTVPQHESGYRQFFRLVTSEFNVWRGKHCGANPKVHNTEGDDEQKPAARKHAIYDSRFQNSNTEGDNEQKPLL